MRQSQNRKCGLYVLASVVVATLLLAMSVPIFGNTLATRAWRLYRLPSVAGLLNKGDVALAMEIGNYYFNGGAYDLKTAERAYRKAVAINPKILWGHYQIARILFVYGKFDDAIIEINKELEANPENLRALYVRGLIYGYRGRPGDLLLAEADFRRFTRWAPSEWAGYNDLAWILSKEAKYQDAKDAMLAALARVADAKKNPWLWNAKGVAELNLGEYADAEGSFGRALELAGALTEADWRKSYPGNDPDAAGAGLDAFKEAIRGNIRRVESLAGARGGL